MRTTQPAPKRADGPRRAPFVALVAGLLGAGFAALLTLNTAAAAAEVQGRQLTAASGNTQDQVTQLKIDIAAKQAPGVLSSEAAALGMVPDPNPVFLSIAPNGSATILGSPIKVPTVVVPTPTPTVAAPPATPTASASPGSTTSTSPAAPTATPTPTPIVTSTLPGGVR
jgi:hypothetical protein